MGFFFHGDIDFGYFLHASLIICASTFGRSALQWLGVVHSPCLGFGAWWLHAIGADRLKYALAATEVKVVQQLARSVFRILRGAIALPRAPYREKVLHRLMRDVEKLEETAPHLKGFLERLRGASGSSVRSSGRNGRA